MQIETMGAVLVHSLVYILSCTLSRVCLHTLSCTLSLSCSFLFSLTLTAGGTTILVVVESFIGQVSALCYCVC
jgi:hypothetical protein